MPITITDDDGIQTVHISERLEIQLLAAEEIVEKMKIRVWFNIETRLPNGKLLGQPYWDSQNPLELSCENNPELEAAMKVIQQAIGYYRYLQLTAPPAELTEEVPKLE